MHLILTYLNEERTFGIDVSENLRLADLRALAESELNSSTALQALWHGESILIQDDKTLADLGIKDQDMIVVIEEHKRLDTDNISNQPGQGSSGRMMHGGATGQTSEGQESHSNKPSDIELLHQQRIEENLQLALEIAPESFVEINLLYIKIKVNGFESIALVDTGAQRTVLHPKLAERYGLRSLIDKRFASMTTGVGSQESKGRIHNASVTLGNIDLPCSFVILDVHVGVLLGLDMLRRHKCHVDLTRDALVVGDHEFPFLKDIEIEREVVPFQEKLRLESGISPKASNTHKVIEESRQTTNKVPPSVISDETSTFPEESIASIMNLGCSKEEAVQALKLAKGNIEIAAAYIFN